MSTTFERALVHTFRFEGGFVVDPDDPGGATNYGVSLRFLLAAGEIERFDYDGDGDLDADDVENMTREQAGEIYRGHFWRDEFDSLDQVLAVKVFDFGVNMGPHQSTRLLQRAANEGAGVGSSYLVVDGIIGPRTLERVRYKSHSGESQTLLGDLEDHAARFYYDLAEKRQASRKYLFGWLRRAYARPEL